MKQLFTETMARYYPNVAERSVDVEMQTIEAGYDPELRVARLIVTAGGTTYHTTPVHASGQVSAVRQMLAAYDNELREIGGYATFDAAEARLRAATERVIPVAWMKEAKGA